MCLSQKLASLPHSCSFSRELVLNILEGVSLMFVNSSVFSFILRKRTAMWDMSGVRSCPTESREKVIFPKP